MSESSFQIFQQIRAAIHRGDRARARALLAGFLKQQPNNINAWLLLSEVVERREQASYCLERVLLLDPTNRIAKKWLQVLQSQSSALTEEPDHSTFISAAMKAQAPGLSKGSKQSRPAETRKILSQQAVQSPKFSVKARSTASKVSVSRQLARATDSQGRRSTPGRKAQPVHRMAEEFETERLRPRRRLNFPLILGALLTFLIAIMAMVGPTLAPRDPLEENKILRISEEWMIPPFSPLTPGFPLGSDQYGRDLYSRLLWAVRPTMTMVLVVAAVRLVVGVLLGLLSGWSNGRLGRTLDTLIQGALALPVLLVALGAIAVVGVELGIWAFIIGLSLIGWVETAQQVRDQTRIVKSQDYIEAAHALGASNRQILLSHVIKQITPMLVMLFAFEMSNTLMATAGLGFLGYYIGGDVWVTVGDFVARRISGMPELGQMLATSWVVLTKPWAMVATGTTIFCAVLGFNLLGEGFRQNLNLIAVRRRGILALASEKLVFWFDQNLWYPLSLLFGRLAVRVALAGLLILSIVLGAGRLLWPQIQPMLEPSPVSQSQLNPSLDSRSSLPSTATGESEQYSNQTSPAITYTPSVLWEFEDVSGFSGGPALASDGDTLYVASKGGVIYALDQEGTVLWQMDLPAGAVGVPALDPDGNIYISDLMGGLSAVTNQGELLWHFQSQAANRSISGPVVASDGMLFYTTTDNISGYVQAVTPQGEGAWSAQANTANFFEQPVLSPDERFIFLKENIFDAKTGVLLDFKTDLKVLRFFSGQDRASYLLSGNTILQWRPNGDRVEILDIAEWDSSAISQVVAPSVLGVTSQGTSWMLYTSPGGFTTVYWVSLSDEFLGSVRYEVSRGQMIAIEEDLTTYVCGGKSFNNDYAECAALHPDFQQPLWEISLGSHGLVQGGLKHGRQLIITTAGGKLFSIAAQPDETVAGTPTNGQEAQPDKPAVPGIVWSYQFPHVIKGVSEISQDGTLYALVGKDTVYILNSDGSLQTSVSLQPGPALLSDAWGFSSHPILPTVMPGGTLLVVSEENSVYAVNTQGERLWEVLLEYPPHSTPVRNGESLYLVDSRAGLYAFDVQGLRWKFRSQEAQNTASPPLVAPVGRVYYTVTNYSKGIVQAVTPDGQAFWASQAHTDSFYDQLRLSPDGNFLFLSDDLFSAQSGDRLEVEPASQVDEFIAGYDGHTYLRSGHTVIQWQLGAQGFENLNTITWESQNVVSFKPNITQVDSNSVVWLYYNEVIIWLSPDSQVLGMIRHNARQSRLSHADLDRTRFRDCQYFVLDRVLECSTYAPGSNDPISQVSIENIPPFEGGFIDKDGFAYLISQDHAIYKLYLGEQ